MNYEKLDDEHKIKLDQAIQDRIADDLKYDETFLGRFGLSLNILKGKWYRQHFKRKVERVKKKYGEQAAHEARLTLAKTNLRGLKQYFIDNPEID
jgi:hypothetical protein